MAEVGPLLRFSPGALPHADLEAIFVKREPLVAKLIRSVADTAASGGAHHHLLVGSRGIGKTHVVALVAHRLAAGAAGDNVRVAWLDEDPWRIRDYDSLVLAIGDVLAEVPAGDPSAVEAEVSRLAADGAVVVLAENLDDVFGALGEPGESRLRAWLERTPRLMLIATATARFEGVRSDARPFFGMFDVDDLRPLDADEARELMGKVAARSGDGDLERFLDSPLGRARLKVVEHLAGGHPRVWLLLAGCLNIEALDELVPLFVRSLDDLTPYYQSRIAVLGRDQRAIVMTLVDAAGARSVSGIASATRLEQRSVSVQVRELVAKGYLASAEPPGSVATTGDGRVRWYELNEPLMRLALKVKEARGEPLEVVVEFLRSWYGPLAVDLVAAAGAAQPLLRRYLTRAIDDPAALSAHPLFEEASRDERAAWLRGAAAVHPSAYEPLIGVPAPASVGEGGDEDDPDAHWLRGNALADLGRHEEALAAYDTALQHRPDHHATHHNRGVALALLDRHEEALAAFDTALQHRPDHHATHHNRGNALRKLGRDEEALDAYDTALQHRPDHHATHFARGMALAEMERYEDALAAYDTALQHRPDHPDTHHNRGLALAKMGRYEDALAAVGAALAREATPETLSTVAELSLLAHQEVESVRRAYDRALQGMERDAGLAKESVRWLLAEFPKRAVERLRATGLGFLVDVFAAHGFGGDVGAGVVAALPQLLTALPHDDSSWLADHLAELALRDRSAVGEPLGHGVRGAALLRVPATITRAAVRFWADRDQAHLLELPIELRTLLEPLIRQADELVAAGRVAAGPARGLGDVDQRDGVAGGAPGDDR